MSRRFRFFLFSILFLCFCHASQAQSGILSAPRIGNWTNAGVNGGIPTNWTQCGATIAPYGTSGSPASGSTIVNRQSSCTPNQYILLGAGDFYISDGICWHGVNDLELRGSDPGTRIHFYGECNGYYLDTGIGFSSSQNCATVNGTITCPNTANVSGTLSKGSTTITLSAVPSLVVGGVINLIRSEDTSDIGSFFEQANTSGGNPFTPPGNAGPYSWQGENSVVSGFGETQVVEVTQCDGNSTFGHGCSSGSNITIYPGIDAPQWANGTAQAWWAQGTCDHVGVNNITIDATNDGAGVGSGDGVQIFNCSNAWVTKSATQSTSRAGILFVTSQGGTFSNNYIFYSDHSIPSGSTSYGIEVSASSDVLIENNICQAVASCVVPQGGTQNIVEDYNFTTFPLYGASSNYQVSDIEPHGIGNDYHYMEGNILSGSFDADIIHGSGNMGTFFRNYFAGVAPACYVSGSWPSITVGACTNGNLGGAILEAFHRYYNSIANVVGNPTSNGYQNTGSIPVYVTGVANNSSAADPVTTNTFLKWGNYDYVTGANRFCGNSSDTGWSTTCGSTSEIPTGDAFYPNSVPTVGDTGAGQGAFPASFIYNSRPSWWPAGKPWPIIGPDVTGGNLIYCTGGNNARAYMTNSSTCTGAGGTASSIAGGRVYSNPAMDCFFSMGGNPQGVNTTALPFEASACYSLSSPPSPPTGLIATVQ